jgi:hypothetical protein
MSQEKCAITIFSDYCDPGATQVIRLLLADLNNQISFRTSLNYHGTIFDNMIVIPIYTYGDDESKMNLVELIEYKVNILTTFIENYDLESSGPDMLYVIRTLTMKNIDIQNLFCVHVITPNNINYDAEDIRLHFKFPKLKYPTIKRINLLDNSIITILVDPYIKYHGVFCDYSKSFDDMGMGFNSLHVFEHMMTKAWTNLDMRNVIYYNGFTNQDGRCVVFTIHKNAKNISAFTIESIKFQLKCRTDETWNELKDDLILETRRTISETRNDKFYSSFARSDLSAFKFNYDTNIFKYYASDSINVLVISNKAITFDVNSINNEIMKYPKFTARPPNVVINYIPLSSLRMKSSMKLYRLKKNTSEIINDLVEMKQKIHLYGIDSELINEDVDISSYNRILLVLLHLGNHISESELQTYISKKILPPSCIRIPDWSYSNTPSTDEILFGDANYDNSSVN